MSASRVHSMIAWILASCGVSLATPPAVYADSYVTAVYSKVMSNGYVHRKLPDGSFQPEEYYLGNGGRYDKHSGDASIDKLDFPDIEQVVVKQLGTQNYVRARGSKTAKLMIVVRWGTTTSPNRVQQALNPALENIINSPDSTAVMVADTGHNEIENNFTDRVNAGILGYDWGKIAGSPNNRDKDWRQMLFELEDRRYFVVVIAYDFQAYFSQKQPKELWETRCSISDRNIDFTQALPLMAETASGYFGKDSNGLQRTPVPEGKVKVDEPKAIGEVEAPQK